MGLTCAIPASNAWATKFTGVAVVYRPPVMLTVSTHRAAGSAPMASTPWEYVSCEPASCTSSRKSEARTPEIGCVNVAVYESCLFTIVDPLTPRWDE